VVGVPVVGVPVGSVVGVPVGSVVVVGVDGVEGGVGTTVVDVILAVVVVVATASK
jgi:hypothetical protein